MNKKNEIVLFETEDKEIKLCVPVEHDTVWLTQAQMTELFNVDRTVITKHVNNVFRENELDKKSNVQKMHITNADRPVQFYSLDVIISVGYRVKSQRGVEFRRWANSVLRDYILKGYAVNNRRLEALQKTVEIQSKMLSSVLEIDGSEVLQAVNQYTSALTLLDKYDHQSLEKPEGNAPIYRITYEECRKMVDSMEDTFKSDVFGVEKEAGKVEGIIAAVYQSVFGGDVYPSLEEKAANLLYFMIKDHPFADGCKRIAASLFLEFLNKNNVLFKEGKKVISDGALVALTLMIAESRPEEKDIMTALVMNIISL
ncbi:MAG: virulence protein RhuM/Fic/DOC family protein [Lachnospiraceae bacterium]|nr:virulence protein RhuM/Fic/DOC family protein [Lachnospiraceae bacterium]